MPEPAAPRRVREITAEWLTDALLRVVEGGKTFQGAPYWPLEQDL